MTTIEEHKKTVKSLVRDINEKIRAETIVEMQKMIGFAESEAAVNLLAILLHKNNLVQPGYSINHRWFKSERIANEKFNFEFPKKTILVPLLIKQEDFREKLCYGKNRPESMVTESLKNFSKIKKIIEKEVGGVI